VGVGARARACAGARVALRDQHAKRRHIAICGLFGSTIFFDIVLNGTISEKRKVTERKMFSKLSLSSMLLHQNPAGIPIFPIRATCSVHLIFLGSITRIQFRPFSRWFLPLWPRYFPQQHILEPGVLTYVLNLI
jgi:hypothetical protein